MTGALRRRLLVLNFADDDLLSRRGDSAQRRPYQLRLPRAPRVLPSTPTTGGMTANENPSQNRLA